MDKTSGETKRDTCSNAIVINQLIFSLVRVRYGERTARTRVILIESLFHGCAKMIKANCLSFIPP